MREVTARMGNEAEPVCLPALIERFEAESPDIDVELSNVSRTDRDLVLPLRLQGGDPPDVLMTDTPLSESGIGGTADGSRPGLRLDGASYILALETIEMGNFVKVSLLGQVRIDKTPDSIDLPK